jgi:hypothetical protein
MDYEHHVMAMFRKNNNNNKKIMTKATTTTSCQTPPLYTANTAIAAAPVHYEKIKTPAQQQNPGWDHAPLPRDRAADTTATNTASTNGAAEKPKQPVTAVVVPKVSMGSPSLSPPLKQERLVTQAAALPRMAGGPLPYHEGRFDPKELFSVSPEYRLVRAVDQTAAALDGGNGNVDPDDDAPDQAAWVRAADRGWIVPTTMSEWVALEPGRIKNWNQFQANAALSRMLRHDDIDPYNETDYTTDLERQINHVNAGWIKAVAPHLGLMVPQPFEILYERAEKMVQRIDQSNKLRNNNEAKNPPHQPERGAAAAPTNGAPKKMKRTTGRKN